MNNLMTSSRNQNVIKNSHRLIISSNIYLQDLGSEIALSSMVHEFTCLQNGTIERIVLKPRLAPVWRRMGMPFIACFVPVSRRFRAGFAPVSRRFRAGFAPVK